MKIFVSWSGQTANLIALALKAWLPQVNPQFTVFVSSESIRPGKTWFDELRSELQSADYGIGIFTPENIASAWMFFEHGAIAGQRDFAPLLCGCSTNALRGTPATLFQAKEFQKAPFFELVRELNGRCSTPHDTQALSKLFNRLWPDVNKKVAAALAAATTATTPQAIDPNALVPPDFATMGVEVLPPYADLELQKIFRDARRRVDCLVLSGRNLFSPAVFETLRERIVAPESEFKVRILAMDVYSEGHFFERRKEMMGSGLSKVNYERDLDTAREHARNLAILDPEHKRFDVRFYHLMPTQYFFLVDDIMYLTFVLSTPVGRCPVIKLDVSRNAELRDAFESHFEHYWDSSRYFVSIVAFKPDGTFLMVKNRKRGWEWPGGFIEPNEDPMISAIREFREESGYEIDDVLEVRRDASGTFYAGRLGPKVGEVSPREMAGSEFFAALPKAAELSFPSQRATFAEVLDDARSMLGQAPPSAS